MLFTLPTLTLEAVRTSAASAALAQAPELGSLSIQDGALGTARRFVKTTDVRTASGWLSARRPVTFMAGRSKSLGTELQSSFEMMVRAVSGWLSARPSQNFSKIQARKIYKIEFRRGQRAGESRQFLTSRILSRTDIKASIRKTLVYLHLGLRALLLSQISF